MSISRLDPPADPGSRTERGAHGDPPADDAPELDPEDRRLFGVLLLSETLGWAGWTGCVVMLAAMLLAEPAAAGVLRRLVPART